MVTISAIVQQVNQFVDTKAPILGVLTAILLPLAHRIQFFTGDKNPTHPVRVKKAGLPTNIIPQRLIDMGFKFNYSFAKSLEHWRNYGPEDFK
ncbi:MAG: hypothetical protein PHD43_03365 [Methylococcales bacterium]|nr:hypothetical protein [Methylococcales bacterium]